MGEFVRLEVADGVGTIRLDRPKMNALNIQVQEEIRAAAVEAAERDDVARSWSTAARRSSRPAPTSRRWPTCPTPTWSTSGALQAAFTAVARIPKPVVAAINGYALGGGCELALAPTSGSRPRTPSSASPRSCSGSSRAGRHPAADASGRSGQAKDLIYTGRFVKADEALSIGLVDRLLPAAEVYGAAVAWARTFATRRRTRCAR